jgi:hypothetical protein
LLGLSDRLYIFMAALKNGLFAQARRYAQNFILGIGLNAI